MKNVTINSRKFDGTVHRSWTAELISSDHMPLIFKGVFDRTVRHPALGLISKGTISYEYYWLDRWYNVFRFYEPDGRFRNYYCNISLPPTFADGILDYVDLDIDVVVSPDFSVEILDVEEFEENSLLYGYSPEIRERATQTLADLEKLISIGDVPFDRRNNAS